MKDMSKITPVEFSRNPSSFSMVDVKTLPAVESVGFVEIVVQQIYHHSRNAAVYIPGEACRLTMVFGQVLPYLSITVVDCELYIVKPPVLL